MCINDLSENHVENHVIILFRCSDMKPKVSLFEDFFFSTKAEILKYKRLKIEMLRFVKLYKLLNLRLS